MREENKTLQTSETPAVWAAEVQPKRGRKTGVTGRGGAGMIAGKGEKVRGGRGGGEEKGGGARGKRVHEKLRQALQVKDTWRRGRSKVFQSERRGRGR